MRRALAPIVPVMDKPPPVVVPDHLTGPCIRIPDEVSQAARVDYHANKHLGKTRTASGALSPLHATVMGYECEWAVARFFGSAFKGLPNLKHGDGGFDLTYEGAKIEVKSLVYPFTKRNYRPWFMAQNPNEYSLQWNVGVLCFWDDYVGAENKVWLDRVISRKRFLEQSEIYPKNPKLARVWRDEMAGFEQLFKKLPRPKPIPEIDPNSSIPGHREKFVRPPRQRRNRRG